MEKNYIPTKREVLEEIVNGIRNVSMKEKFSKTGNSLKEFLTMAGGVGFDLSVVPYIIPSTARITKENWSKEMQFTTAEKVGGFTGLVLGAVVDGGQIMAYTDLVQNDCPEALLVPVATNVASGVYEIGRKLYKDAKQRIADKQILEESKSEDYVSH